ncbi:hypothetical protein [uncultured Serinicoccus sp.]|uniref:hypothetical protein n=1 Tax=uncultured Serinicoccus sp. TaxID=735514 RepID=UPI00262B5CB4|nr:hypothetical protein [uncultured Serinicoccus sp.]
MTRTADEAMDPRHLAPTVERRWLDAFLLERNLLGVRPDRLGDDVVTVESHVRESNESAQEVFGDPVAYARALPVGADRETGLRRTDVAHICLGLAGLMLTAWALTGWLRGDGLAVTGGDLGSAALLGLLTALLLAAPEATLRVLVGRRRVVVVAPILLIGGFVAVQLLWPEELFTLPVLGPTLVGLAALLASSVIAYRTFRDGALRAPGEAAAPGAARRRWTLVLLYPVLLVFLVLMGWVPSLFG